MKLLAFVCLLVAFGLRYGPQKEKDITPILFYISFGIEFCPCIFNLFFLCVNGSQAFNLKVWKSLLNYYSFMDCLFFLTYFLTHFIFGIFLIHAFRSPEVITLSDQKGLAGCYIICCAYSLFRTFRGLLLPNWSEMFGWFEVVFKDIIKLLFVSK